MHTKYYGTVIPSNRSVYICMYVFVSVYARALMSRFRACVISGTFTDLLFKGARN